MEREKFIEHFRKSTELLVDFTKQHCYNDFVENYLFIVKANGSDFHDGLNEFEKKNLKILNRYAKKVLAFDQVVELLHRENQVPLWINMSIYESKSNATIFELICSRRLRPDEKLFYKAVKYPPFNVKVPIPPDVAINSDLLRNGIGEKFDVNWRKRLLDKQKHINILEKLRRIFTNKNK